MCSWCLSSPSLCCFLAPRALLRAASATTATTAIAATATKHHTSASRIMETFPGACHADGDGCTSRVPATLPLGAARPLSRGGWGPPIAKQHLRLVDQDHRCGDAITGSLCRLSSTRGPTVRPTCIPHMRIDSLEAYASATGSPVLSRSTPESFKGLHKRSDNLSHAPGPPRGPEGSTR